jgi:hypothetical protein
MRLPANHVASQTRVRKISLGAHRLVGAWRRQIIMVRFDRGCEPYGGLRPGDFTRIESCSTHTPSGKLVFPSVRHF